MKVKVFYPDRDGNIRFSKKELEALLDEVYNEGYSDGRRNPYWTWTSPYYTTTTTPSYITTCGDSISCASTNGNIPDNVTISSSANTPFTYTSSNITGSIPKEGQVLQKAADNDPIEYSKLNVSYKTA